MTTTAPRPAGSDARALTDEEIDAGQRARELDRAHVFHSWSAQGQLNPMTILRAEGSRVCDGEGNELLDLSSPVSYTHLTLPTKMIV